MSQIKNILPLFACGKVVKGFGRGSKDLGIPTANIQEEIVDGLPQELSTGIYYGLATVDNGTSVYKMVMSVGWNPYYHNKRKSMESHLLHEFKDDFYGGLLKVIIIGYIRPEKDFSSLEELVQEIKNDIKYAEGELLKDCSKIYWEHPFWQENSLKHGVFMYNSANSFHGLNGFKKSVT